MQPSLTPGDDVSGPWYELGGLYAAAAEDARKATSGGFIVAFVAAAQVLLSAPLFGTSWAGPFAALIPPTAGLLFGGGSLWWRRAKFSKRRGALRRELAMRGEDANRPTARGLGAYYDAQLILLRCEYEPLEEPEDDAGAPPVPTAGNLLRLHPGGRVRVWAAKRRPRHTEDEGAQSALGGASLGDEDSAGDAAALSGARGGRQLPRLPPGNDCLRGACDTRCVSGDLLQALARELRREAGDSFRRG